MNNRIVQLLKSRDFSRLAAMIEERYGLATSSEGYEYIYFLAFHSGTTVGGSDTDPWSDSSWWAWVKRQVLHLQSRSPAELLAKVKSQYVALPSSADDWQRLL